MDDTAGEHGLVATTPGPSPVPDSPFQVGAEVDQVSVDIDYAIIKHFSEHLYSSPNKAIEELVTNGFDAMATRCYIYIPGQHVQDRVLVWDNGQSMDTAGLQAMWQIARSPKENLGVGRINSIGERRRAVIGKFGIGKLASYAVGHRISHLCRTSDDRFLSVSVNYRSFTDDAGHPDPASSSASIPATNAPATITPTRLSTDASMSAIPIRELTESQMFSLIGDLLPSGDAVKFMRSEKHWTLAVIDDLKDVALYPGRLMWVLGNGMPLRPDFRVFVEDGEVTTRLASNADTTWTFAEPKLREALLAAWAEAAKRQRVAGEIDFAPRPRVEQTYSSDDPATDEPAIEFPTLGRVSATVRLFGNSLALRAQDEGRSYGFFVTVRGRLVNPDDDKLLLHDPSFGTFYRSQYLIRADSMDADLLADRESLRRDTPMSRELQVLQTALYRAARSEIESGDEVKSKGERPESRLPARSRELFRDPMEALLSRSEGRGKAVDYDEPVIRRVDLGEDAPLAELDTSTGHLLVNKTHPFFKAVETQAGSGKRAAATLRAFDLYAVVERLTEGFLYGRGVSDAQISDLLTWRDKLFRTLATNFDRNADDAILELRASSVPGGSRFEIAITNLFSLMGFVADRHGEPGFEDILVMAPLGPAHRTFIVEAKGSDKPVTNVPAAIASAAAHRDAVDGAVHAIVVAREFAGFKNKDEPQILKECQAVHDVSVVTVETLVQLYNALLKYAYPLENVMDVLFAIETPSAKQDRVEAMDQPLEDFNYRQVLDEIWVRQAGESIKDQVPTRALWQSRPAWREGMTFPVFTEKLAALNHFAGTLMSLDPNEKTVYLRHHPEKVVDHVHRSVMHPDASPPPSPPPKVEE